MWAMIVKELRQLRRDRRTLGLMVLLPLVLLLVFGYAASFDVPSFRTVVAGPAAQAVAGRLPEQFEVVAVEPGAGREQAVERLRDGEAVLALVTDEAAGAEPVRAVLVDGSDLFAARAAVTAAEREPGLPAPEVLFNPGLRTATVMIPAIIGLILVFAGTLATSLGVVRERQAGTLEQLAVMPFRPRDVFAGKVLPYLCIALVQATVVVLAGLLLFDVPFEGSVAVFALGVLLFLFVTLGYGVLVSTVSENQAQAIQLTMMTVMPQILLSGMVFPLDAMADGVRWISYLLPLTYFIQVMRGVMVRGASFDALLFPLGMLALLGMTVTLLSLVRFHRELTSGGGAARRKRRGRGRPALAAAGLTAEAASQRGEGR